MCVFCCRTFESMASKRDAMNCGVSDWRKTSICCCIEERNSASGFSFLMSAITYLDSAAGSASHLQEGYSSGIVEFKIIIPWEIRFYYKK